MAKVRVYAVEKKKGWDVLSHRDMQSGNIPKTVTHVHFTWGNGKETKTITREEFLAAFKHTNMAEWELIEVPTPAAEVESTIESKEVKQLRKLVAQAETKALKAMEARRALSPGATRAKVTTANARWASACEHRDHLQKKLDELKKSAS